MYKSGLVWVLLAMLLSACGTGVVEVDSSLYKPKIVVEAFIYPNHPVNHVKITRNFPLNTTISRDSLYLPHAEVTLIDQPQGTAYKLTFDSLRRSYIYSGDDLKIEYNHSYRLEVTATIDGQLLQASSVTTTPAPGFAIDTSASTRQISYFAYDLATGLKKPELHFSRSPGTDFYAFSIIAENGDLNHFIRPPRNPFIPPRWTEQDIAENLDELKHSQQVILNAPPGAGETTREMEWFHFMFYGRYRIIGYAADQNFKDYYLTFQRVVEMDGNLHEPVMHFSGDGIGVFASAITDTIYLEITK